VVRGGRKRGKKGDRISRGKRAKKQFRIWLQKVAKEGTLPNSKKNVFFQVSSRFTTAEKLRAQKESRQERQQKKGKDGWREKTRGYSARAPRPTLNQEKGYQKGSTKGKKRSGKKQA